MGLKDRVFHLIADLLVERPVRNRTLAELREELNNAGREAQQQLATAADTQQNREALRHIIGIERWGLRRLQVVLGAPLVMDESDEYYPCEDAGWDQLRETFRETRQKMVLMVDKLEKGNVGRDLLIPHNQWGELSVYGWLHYLNGHANRDVKGIT